MCFETYNHRFENTWRCIYASSQTFGKTANFLAAVLQLRVVLTLITGKCVNTSYVCHDFLQFFIFCKLSYFL